MKNLKIIFLLSIVNFNLYAAGDPFPRTAILPENIEVSTPVKIGIAVNLAPCLATSLSYPTFYHLSANNQISFVFAATGVSPCQNIPGYALQYDIGTLPAGSYTAQVYGVSSPNEIPKSFDEIPLQSTLGSPLNFTVRGSGDPVSVPSNNLIGFSIMLGAFLLGTFLFSIRKNIFLISTLMLSVTGVQAKSFILLISAEEGAPTIDQIVNISSTSPPPASYPLSAFNEYRPDGVAYLFPDRPFGQRLDLINQYPDWRLTKLYQYIIVSYPESVETENLLTSFRNDEYILTASDLSLTKGTLSSGNQTKMGKSKSSLKRGGFTGNYLTDLNISQAWSLSEGMGYIGVIDSGIDVDHPAFEAFSDTGVYQGGNLLDSFYQIDYASGDGNVDEQEPIDIGLNTGFEPCDLAFGDDDNLAASIYVGHGTHVSGIIAAKNSTFDGICKNCGLGMFKWTFFGACNTFSSPPTMQQRNEPAVIPVILGNLATSGGFATVNWSGGLNKVRFFNGDVTIETDEFYCQDVNHAPQCDALEILRDNNVMMVSSGGNFRNRLQFPAGEPQTIAAGGVDDNGIYWNESPGPGGVFDISDESNCPFTGDFNECGSNFSNPPIDQKVDTLTQATAVYSTFYPEGKWSEYLDCSDISDGIDDGFGFCTGTSMSSPQVAAIVQLMRSTNPLLPNGDYDPNANSGIINILNSTSSRSQANQGINDFLGYGIPDAYKALEKILGYSNGILMKTRLTPMFEVVSIDEENNSINNVYSPFPQIAYAFLTGNGLNYDSNNSVPLVQEFDHFWYGPNFNLPAPRASFYVFTTNNNPFINSKNMVPLRRMEKTIAGNNRNDTYAVSTEEIEDFHDEGYNYAGIEGYILPTCPLVPGCIPGNSHILYRVVDDVNFNHTLVNLPIATPAPANSTILGYVYPNVDTDGDGLIDGQERILGTLIGDSDTDDDGLLDGVEYPPAGVPYSDPRISDIIFEDGFE